MNNNKENKINKFKVFNTYILKWDVIHYLYNSFLGKILLLLGIVSITLSLTSVMESNIESLWFLSTSILIFIIGYIIYIIFIPTIVRDFSRYDFVQYMVQRDEKKQLSIITEFSFLENKELDELPIYLDSIDNFTIIKSIDNFSKNTQDALYQLSQIKFDYLNNVYLWARVIITLLLIAFIVTFYYMSISKMINYIIA